MQWRVAQIQRPINKEMTITEPCFVLIGNAVWSVLEARDIVEDCVIKGGQENWFIILQTYPTRNQ